MKIPDSIVIFIGLAMFGILLRVVFEFYEAYKEGKKMDDYLNDDKDTNLT